MPSYLEIMDAQMRNQLTSHPFIPYLSVVGSVFFCKLIYDFTHLFSSFYFKSYAGLKKVERTEWNNRGISTAHAIFIAGISAYLVFFSALFHDDHPGGGFIIFRSTSLSDFALGVSAGYFIVDLAMITWQYPTLGGLEYVLHHLLAVIPVAYAMLSGEGQLYTFMVLLSEMTTPGINLKWYLDKAGMKASRAYIINGIMIFFSWLMKKLHTFGYLLLTVVPSILTMMNLVWFTKIYKGVKKTLAKRE